MQTKNIFLILILICCGCNKEIIGKKYFNVEEPIARLPLLRFIFPAIFVCLFIPGCEKDKPAPKDEWIEIDSVLPNAEISEKLNSIFVSGWNRNECLKIKNQQVYLVNSIDEYYKIDTCNTIPEIDFSKYTLAFNCYGVPYDAYKITNVRLESNKGKASYYFEISMDTCEWCWTVSGYEYFWRMYPKLNPEYEVIDTVKNVK